MSLEADWFPYSNFMHVSISAIAVSNLIRVDSKKNHYYFLKTTSTN